MENSRNLILAVALSALVLVAWQYFFELPKQRQAQAIALEKKQAEAVKTAPEVKTKSGEIAFKDRTEVVGENSRITISNGEIDGSINLKGARFDDLSLVHYKQTIEKQSPEVVLLSPANTVDVYFGEFGWIAGNPGIKVPDENSLWKADADKLTLEKPVTLTWDNGQGLVFKQMISIDKNYMFEIKQSVENNSGKPVDLMNYGLVNRSHHKSKTYYILHEGPLGVFNNTLEEVTYKSLTDDKKREFQSSGGGWAGITDKYWLTALIPDRNENFQTSFTYIDDKGIDKYQVDFLSGKTTVNPGESQESKSHFFAGAKKVRLLDSYSKNLNIPLFDRAIDFGWFYFLTKRLFYALNFFYMAVGNFGLAIMLLTLCVKLLMFPLANKSYKSMSQMKALQPEINKIRERNKDDKIALNQEIMKLYKKDGVNPLSGCLPLVIQIPVFFSLYKVLFVTIEMRHAPFFGWIKDLSAPDPTSLFNLFGLIPFTPPHFLMIGVLPILMALTMFLQQRLNPAPSDPVQAQMMKFLPLIFLFLFASFPAGLVLYWVCSNTLSIIQQLVISRKIAFKRKAKAKNE